MGFAIAQEAHDRGALVTLVAGPTALAPPAVHEVIRVRSAREMHAEVMPRATGADVVLMDPQYAPRVIAKPNADGMVSLIAATAKAEHVGIFHRFELMRHWYDAEHLPFEAFVSQDGLHMNDWSYACLAKALGMAIAEAMTRGPPRPRPDRASRSNQTP